MGINWARAAADLIKAANNAGVFQLEKMRGRGVWLDGGQVVWHLGHALEVDGKPVSLTDYRSAHQYALMQSLPIKTQVEPLDDAHGQKILKVLRDCAWIGASDHLHLAGFCVLSSVCGALDKRPGLQITSPFSSGKTDTIDNVIMPLQGGIGLLSSGSTEAGVRQLLGSDALPATIDESEAEEGRRREAQLRLVRFSYDGKPQFKGTPGQGALTYCLRSSLALAGINSPIDNPADGSRIAVISRRMLPADQWAAVTRQRAAVITQEIGQRLIRRTVSTLPALRANVATFKKIITDMVTTGEAGRTGDTWGALLAGAHHLISTQAISEAEAAAWLDSVGWHLSHTDADEQDRRAGAEGRQCLDHLLSHETRWVHPADREEDRPTTGSVALRELVALAKRSVKFIDKDEAEKELGRKGVRVTLEGLAVANHAPGTAVIFGKTKWAGGAHRGRLLELDGAQRSSGPIHFACSGSRRAVLVPWGTVGDLGDEEPAQAA
jgi:putative DNA primase/helicase